MPTHITLVCHFLQSSEVKSSYHMEIEGLKQNLDKLESLLDTLNTRKKIEVTTDGHKQVKKHLREERSETVKHYLDIWHVAKNLNKKLKKLKSKLSQRWSKSIINHLYWVVKISGPDIALRLAAWRSLTNHMANIHEHDGEEYREFPRCSHGDLSGERKKAWFKPGTEEYDKLCDVLLKKVASNAYKFGLVNLPSIIR